jgi:tetratricopeptide (TPR) repeat protein
LSAQAPEKNLFVDDVVTALTGPVDARGHATSALKDQMKRAADEFDQRTAEAFARALLESLCAEEIDLRRLEALLILGLAHPTILDRHRISLRTEGRRLATMLEHQGQVERARCLLETIQARAGAEDDLIVDTGSDDASQPKARNEEQIDVLLRRADECAARGKTAEAIHWLQEVVLIDRNRRDVARMIRDLRWQGNERKARNLRRLKLAGLILVVGGLVAGITARETQIAQQYQGVPPAAGDLASLRERLASIDGLVDANHFWFGMSGALREQSRLRRDISTMEQKAAEIAHEATIARDQKIELADLAMSRGMLLAQQGHFEQALTDLRQALVLSDKSWSERAKIQANVDAIEAWMKKSK